MRSINKSENGSKSIPSSNKWLGYSFFILNLYLLIRLFVTVWNRYQILNIQSKITIAGFILITAGLLFYSLQERIIKTIIGYFQNTTVIFEIFVVYLISSQVLNWFLNFITSAAAFEIRGWFITNTIGFICCYLFVRIKLAYDNLSPIWSENHIASHNGKYTVLLTIGIVLIASGIVGYWLYTQVYSPLPHYYHYDPEYGYMLSASTPFKDTMLYKRMDHPGSLMQLLGSFFTVIISTLSLKEAGYPTYLNTLHPEYFIFVARFFILFITITAIIILSKKIMKLNQWQDIFAGLSIPLIYFASQQQALEFTAIWSPNSFNFALGTIILFLLLMILTSKNERNKNLLWLSFATGIIATFHIYLITWIIGVGLSIFIYTILSRGKIGEAFRLLGLTLFQFLKGYLVGILVIFDEIGSFLDWIFGILIHQGTYGSGSEGFINTDQILNNIKLILDTNYVLIFTFLIILLLILLFITSRKDIRNNPGLWAVAIGLIFQVGFLFLLVLKQPRERYLLSISSVLPILLAALLLLIQSKKKINRFLYPSIFIILMSSFTVSFLKNINLHIERIRIVDTFQKDVDGFISTYATSQDLEKSELRKYWTYGSYSECYSLWFGNEYGKNLFNEEIGEICIPKNEYSINVWSKQIRPIGIHKLKDIGQDSVIIGESTRLNKMGLDGYIEHKSTEIDNISYFVPDNTHP